MTFKSLIELLINLLLQGVVPLIFVLVMVLFFWGIVKYISHGSSEEQRKQGVAFITYSIIGLFVMFAVWGLTGFLSEYFNSSVFIPQL